MKINSINDLRNYAYLCVSKQPNQSIIGTCFFYKNEDKIFMVSAHHTFSGINPFSGARAGVIENVYLIYVSEITGEKKELQIAVPLFSSIQPDNDIFAIPVKAPDDLTINYINDFINNSTVEKCSSLAYISGYPDSQQYASNTNYFAPNNILCITQVMSERIGIRGQYLVLKTNPALQGGISGAPIFGIDESGDQKEYFFLGTTSGGSPGTGQVVVLDGRTSLIYLSSLNN